MSALACVSVHAKVVTILDQHGKPVENAVLSIPSEATSPPTEQAIVDQKDKQFVPRIVAIKAGQQVVFPNSDNIRHHVYSFSSTKPFELKLYSGTEAPPVTFEKPGIVVLGCNIHDQMVGYIYVAGNEQTWMTNAAGEVDLPADVSAFTLWHPMLAIHHTKRIEVSLADGQNITVVELIEPAKTESKSTFGGKTF